MRSRLACVLVFAVPSVLAVGGCSGLGSAERGNVSAAAVDFVDAYSADPAEACELLAPRTLEELESSEGPCEQSLAQQEVGDSVEVEDVEVYGKDAVVHTDVDTLFLARFRDGWKVTAAGCRPQGDRPYDCSVKGD